MGSLLSGYKSFSGIAQFSGSRFADLLGRRGWSSVLWEKARKCPCYSENTGNPDPNDPACGGTGYIFEEDLEVPVKAEQLTIVVSGQSAFVLNASLDGSPDITRTIVPGSVRVYNVTTGEVYTITSLSGQNISISGVTLPLISETVYADYTFLRDSGATVRAIITNVDYQRDYIPSGEWLAGDAVMTVAGQLRMGFRDRITIPEKAVRTSEFKRRYEMDTRGRSLERLRYKTGITLMSVRDKTQVFTLGTDFTLGPDQTFVWGSGLRPRHNAFNIKYVGNATSATLAISGTALSVTLVGQTDGSLSLNLLFSSFPTVKDIVAEIQAHHAKYVVNFEEQGNISGIDNGEDMTKCVPVASQNIKNVAYVVVNEDKTQYAVEYMHFLAYSIYNKQGNVRRPDSGTILPSKYWLRLWESTDLFGNGANYAP